MKIGFIGLGVVGTPMARHRKDLNLALEIALALCVSLPNWRSSR